MELGVVITHEPAEMSAPFALDSTLYGLVRPAVDRRADVRLALPGRGAVAVLASQGRYRIVGEDPVTVCAEDRRLYRVQRLRSGDGATAQTTAAGSIDELYWTIGYAASGGRLVDALAPTDVLQLTEWPNLTRVPLGPHGLRLAVLMRRRPTSIPVAASIARAPRAHVQRFVSAAWSASLIRVVNRASSVADARERAENPTPTGMSVVKSLLRRLRGD